MVDAPNPNHAFREYHGDCLFEVLDLAHSDFPLKALPLTIFRI